MGGRITIAATLFLFMCGEDEAAVEVTVESEPPGAVVADVLPGSPPAANGGTVVAAGPHYVEVVAHDDGEVDAYVLADDAPPPAQMQLTVRLTGDDGESHPVILIWDPSQSRYRGRLRQVQPMPGPVEVVLVYGGDTYRGRRSTVIVLAPNAAPTVVVQGRGRPPRPAARVVVERPGPPPPPNAHIVIQRPQPTVVVHRPGPPVVEVRHARPRHQVVVEGPRHRPGRVRVGRRGRARGRHRGRGRKHGRGARVRIRH